MPWLTGSSIPVGQKCRVISVPDDPVFVGAVAGALLDLTYEINWEKLGTLTPAEQAAAFDDIYIQFTQSICIEPTVINYPKSIIKFPQQFIRVAGTMLLPVYSNVSMYALRSVWSPIALNDEFKVEFECEVGIWDFMAVAHRINNAAIFTPYFDGVAKTTWDLYAAVAVNNLHFAVSQNQTVSVAGKHTINIKAASKNASSSGYNLPFSAIYGVWKAALP